MPPEVIVGIEELEAGKPARTAPAILYQNGEFFDGLGRKLQFP